MDLISFYMDCLGVDEETAKTIISELPLFRSVSRRALVHDPQVSCKELADKYPQRGMRFFKDNIAKLIFAVPRDSILKVISEIDSFFCIPAAGAKQKWQNLCEKGAFTFEEFRAAVKASLKGDSPDLVIKKTCDLFDLLFQKDLLVEETYLGV